MKNRFVYIIASEAKALGSGGKQLIESELCISHNTINRGIAELESPRVATKPGAIGDSEKKEEGESAA
jgi:hypothetical protein